MKILLLCDDYYHPGEIPVEGTAPLREHGLQFDIVSDAADFDSRSLNGYGAALMCKCDHTSQKDKTPWKTPEVQRAFVDYVEGGGGLVVVHSGIVAGEETSVLDELIGCRFAFHPNGCPVSVQPLKPHPLTEGVDAFRETDEHYQVEFLKRDAEILLASYSQAQGDETKRESDPYFNAAEQIAACGYVREQGKGRICVLTPGHLLPVWLNKNFQKLLLNAIRWCANK